MSKKIFGRDNTGSILDLSGLGINHNTDGSKNLYNLISTNKKLRTLKLSCNDFGYGEEKAALNLGNFLRDTSLKELDISSCGLGDVRLDYLGFALGVDVSGSKIKVVVSDYAGVIAKTALCAVGTGCFMVIGGMLYYGNVISGVNAIGLLNIPPMLTVYSLVRDNIIVSINNSNYNKSLKILNLSDNNFGSSELKTISKIIKYNKSLTILNLSDNKINSNGVKTIIEGLKFNKSLKILDLSKNKVHFQKASNLVCDIFKSNTSLKVLNLLNQQDKPDMNDKSVLNSYSKNSEDNLPFILKYDVYEVMSEMIEQAKKIYITTLVEPLVKSIQKKLDSKKLVLSPSDVHYFHLFQKLNDKDYKSCFKFHKTVWQKLRTNNYVKKVCKFIDDNYFFLTGISNHKADDEKYGDLNKLSKCVLSEVCSYLTIEDIDTGFSSLVGTGSNADLSPL